MISGCCVFATTGDGIEVAQVTTVRGNQVVTAGLTAGNAAGIHVTGNRNTIDGNSIQECDRGIDVDSSVNWIFRNSCSSNGVNYSIAVGNTYGAIVAGGSNANAVNGSSAPGTMGSTDPWTNLAY